MKGIILFTILSLCTAVNRQICAQGQYLPGGTSGYGITAQAVTQGDAVGSGLSIGYSLLGTIDLSVSASHYFLSDKLAGQTIGANQLEPSVTFYGTGGSPISLLFRLSYTFERYSSAPLDATQIHLNGSYPSFEAAFFIKMPTSGSWTFYPMVGIEYIQGTHNPPSSYTSPISSPSTQTPFIMALPATLTLSSGVQLLLEPKIFFFPVVAIQPGSTELGLSAGFIFPTSH